MVAWRLFPAKLKLHKLLQLLSVEGMPPDRLLLERSSAARLIKLPTSLGIGPMRLLLDRSRAMDKEERPMTPGGMGPSSRLYERFISWRC